METKGVISLISIFFNLKIEIILVLEILRKKARKCKNNLNKKY
jgi:hypothetical protein